MSADTFVRRDTNESSAESSQDTRIIEVDKNGDVYLELPKLELRVSSKALSMASKVFNTMFNSSFREGLDLAANETCRIPLPDDDPGAMHVLCILMHQQDIDSKGELNSGGLRLIAMLADKYSCTGAVKYWAELWIGKLQDELEGSRTDEKAMVDLLVVSYILNLPTRFASVTKRMVYWLPKSMSEISELGWYVDNEAQEVLPQNLIGNLQYREPLFRV